MCLMTRMPTVPRRFAALLAMAALLCLGVTTLHARAATPAGSADDYAHALRLRASLDATPRTGRTGKQYAQVLNAFRAVYHADHGATNADASVEAVAELLAEEGRNFNDLSLLRSAVEQLEFLRRDFGASPFSTAALWTEGEIQTRDLHDSAAARERFSLFLATYPRSSLAPQARAELHRLGGVNPPVAEAFAPSQAAAYRFPGTEGTVAQPRKVGNGALTAADAPAGEADARKGAGRPQSPTDTALAPEGGSRAREASTQPLRAGEGKRASGEGSALADEPASGPISAHPTSAPNLDPANGRVSVINGVPVYRATTAPQAAAKLALVTGVRHWSTASYTRIAIDLGDGLEQDLPFEASRVPNPDRIFFDLHGAKLARELAGKAITVTDGGFLERIRAAQFSGDVVRVVLDVSDVSDYSAFWLPNPSRLIIDIHGRPAGAPTPVFAGNTPTTPQRKDALSPGNESPPVPLPAQATAPPPHTPASRDSAAGTPTPRGARAGAPGVFVSETAGAGVRESAGPLSTTNPGTSPRAGDSLAAIAALSQQPQRVRATQTPTTAPVAAITALPGNDRIASTPAALNSCQRGNRHVRIGKDTGNAVSDPGTLTSPAATPEQPMLAARAAEPDSTGGRSMVRALGLKINRIVVDAGHGGHDSGTLGPGGIEEKDVVLDVALRLGRLLKQRLGADVTYTRDDDTFIPLETRTAIANKAQADLFISVHANSSPDASARGVETYYLNFTTSADALEVAARENAVSDESIHQLSDLVKKITLQDKIAESREFATDVEGSLYQGLETGNTGLKDRGVKKAPFVVLIGANMPSILAEISFLTNPDDASQLHEGAYRQRIAESLYKGVARYVRSLSGARLEESAAAR